jgi:hypothetical protein
MKEFIQRHAASVISVLNGFDRLRLRGTKRWLSNVSGMNHFLCSRKLRFKDFTDYAKGVTDWIRRATEEVAQAAGRSIRYLSRSGTSKEDIARQIAAEDNIREGLIGILSCVEPCWSYQVVRNRQTRHIDLVVQWTKCLHYYHYYLHPILGFMHMRLQTWFPFTVHVCLNGREWLAQQLDAAKIGYVRRDNCFLHLEDPAAAQRWMDVQLHTNWPVLLDRLVPLFNPAEAEIFGDRPVPYYWSVEESEWATDLLFRSRGELAALYPRLLRHGIEHLGSREVMRFLGHSLPAHGHVNRSFKGEAVTDLRERVEGLRIKHRLKRNWIKMYDKEGRVLRVETVINDPRDWKVYRPRESDPARAKAWQPLRKGVADLYRRAKVSQAANQRYLASLATVEANTPLGELIGPLCRPVQWRGQRARALNPLSGEDVKLLSAVHRGEFAINGFRNRDLRPLLFGASAADAQELRRQASAVTRKLRLLRAHSLIQKVQKTHRYMLTAVGRQAITALLAARAADPAKLTAAA